MSRECGCVTHRSCNTLTVVPAEAGTHNHKCCLSATLERRVPFTTRAAAYGSRPSPGRHREKTRPLGSSMDVSGILGHPHATGDDTDKLFDRLNRKPTRSSRVKRSYPSRRICRAMDCFVASLLGSRDLWRYQETACRAAARGRWPASARWISAPSSVFAFTAFKLRRTRFDLKVSAWLRHAKPVRAKRGGCDRDRTCDPYHVNAAR
ncbi:hypothetical protein ACVWY5_000617 [Bradyrhizobium sp. USDA 3256]